MRYEALLQNLERESFFELHPCGAKNRSDRARCSTLLPDNFSKVSLRYPQFQHCCLLAFDRSNGYLIGIVHESFRYLLDELLHSHLQTQM